MPHAFGAALLAARRAAGAVPIRDRVIGGFLLLLAVLISVIVASVLLSWQHRDAMRDGAESERSEDVLRDAERQTLFANLLLERYVVTGSDHLPPIIRTSIAAVEEILTEARSLEFERGDQALPGVDDAAEVAALDELLVAASVISDASEQTINLRASGDVTGAREVLDSAGDDFLSLGSSIALAAELEHREIVARRGQADFSMSWTFTLQIIAAFAGIAVTIIMAAAITRSILKPLDSLRKTARSIAAGDLAAEVPSEGPREIAELGSDLNVMKAELLKLSGKQP